jgi:DNA-binding NarL/FixJ family response regulator
MGGLSMRREIGTLIVSSSTLTREGLARILTASRFRNVIAASCLDEAALDMTNKDDPYLLLISNDGGIDQTTKQIAEFKQCAPHCLVISLSDHFDMNEMLQTFRAGANACLTKFASSESFIKSIELVLLGETLVPAELLSTLLNPAHEPDPPGIPDSTVKDTDPKTKTLSGQEWRILQHMVDGNSNKMIARKLTISEATVKVHVKSILRKLNLHNRTQAAIWATSNGGFALTELDRAGQEDQAPVAPSPINFVSSIEMPPFVSTSISRQANDSVIEVLREPRISESL